MVENPNQLLKIFYQSLQGLSTENGEKMEEQKCELKIIKMSDVQLQEIEWLWYPFIPYGKLTIIQGDPGDGRIIGEGRIYAIFIF